MRQQFKYSLRLTGRQRLWTLGLLVAINLILAIFNRPGFPGTLAVAISSLALVALFVMVVICDVNTVNSLLSAPMGYLNVLAPVPSWKILLSHMIPMLVYDLLSFTLGIAGIVVQAMLMVGKPLNLLMYHSDASAEALFVLLVAILLGYSLLILAIFFAGMLGNTLFFSFRKRRFLGIVGMLLVIYLFGLLNLVLVPFGTIRNFGMMFIVSVNAGFTVPFFVYILLNLCKIVALFAATSHLMERRINL